MDAKVAKALREPFPPEMVGKLPRAGIHLDFVGHAAVTSRLLEVDPEWTWVPANVNEHGEPLLTLQGLSPQTKMGLWIHMTVGGVTRPGFGDGNTIKECISDAIRNAAMRFGVALDLWSKEDLHATDSGAASAEGTPKKKAAARATEEAPPVPVAPAAPSFPPNVETENGVRFASEAQRKRLFAIAKTNGVESARLREILAEVTGQESTAQIPASLYEAVCAAVSAEPVAA